MLTQTLLRFYVISVLSMLGCALLCYESPYDGSATSPTLSNCTNCDYCVFSLDPMQTEEQKPEKFGAGPSVDNTAAYKPVFAQSTTADDLANNPSDPTYSVLSMCILEKYNFGGSISYNFRCFCETDGCNAGDTLEEYMMRTRMRNTLNAHQKKKL